MLNDELFYENVNSEEYLTEMAQFKPRCEDGKYDIIITVNNKTRDGVCYFKVYNAPKYSSATKVARISFKSAELIKNHAEIGGKKEWKLSEINSKTRKEIVDYLNERVKSDPKYTIWTRIRYEWNDLKNIDIGDIDEYISGKYDTDENLKNPNYISYNIPMPNYEDLR